MKKEIKKAPTIRFRGFTGDWEQRKLGDIADVYDGIHQTPDYTDNGIMFLSVENINTLKSEKYISEEAFIRDYKVYPEKGDILMTRIGDVGTPNVVETTEKVAFYVSLALLKPINVDSYFLCNSILSPFFQNGLKERTLVTAIPQKINKDEIGKVGLYLPTLIDEQREIGAFFQRLNHLITLHQRKFDELKTAKKFFLQNMFPAKGEKVPRIRFQGFTGDWEQHKFTEGTSEIGDGLHGTPKYDNDGNVFFINGNNLIDGKIVISSETKMVDETQQSTMDKSLSRNTILMSINGTIGNLAYYSGERVMLGKSIAYINVASFNKDFVYTYLQTKLARTYFLDSLTGTTIKNLGLKAIRNMNLLIPHDIEEQRKIGEYFKNLDMFITLHQRKLDQLKTLKKFMLQNLFI